MPRCTVSVNTPIRDSFRVRQLIGMFDLPERKTWGETFTAEFPGLDEEWTIGCIVGPSGSGKSTLARAAFGNACYEATTWAKDRAIIDGLGDAPIQQITQTLTAVGLGSPPAWLKPYAVLSNGEKFRCELARALLSTAHRSRAENLLVFDEFTSLVDRSVAKIASAAVSRAIRGGRLNCRFVAVTCHADVVPWLEPDWVLDLAPVQAAGPQLQRVRLRRPQLRLGVTRVPQKLWQQFARHHYLSGGLNAAASCFAAWLDERPIAFCALVPVLGKPGQKRISRIVTLPDYQGLGIGMRLAECVADFVRSQAVSGNAPRVSITASHPAVIGACRRSPRWQLRSYKPLGNVGRQKFEQRVIRSSGGRGVATFEYLGNLVSETPAKEQAE
jgi:GNAT superfamily N-acetyltransferase